MPCRSALSKSITMVSVMSSEVSFCSLIVESKERMTSAFAPRVLVNAPATIRVKAQKRNLAKKFIRNRSHYTWHRAFPRNVQGQTMKNYFKLAALVIGAASLIAGCASRDSTATDGNIASTPAATAPGATTPDAATGAMQSKLKIG